MKKYLFAFILIVAFAFYVAIISKKDLSLLQANNSVGSTNSTPSISPTTSNPTPSLSYKDGVYTGPVVDVYYGNVQVQVKIIGGKITSVTFLQHPTGADHSTEINSYATPILAKEAITAQSAAVDGVSGATHTSEGFKKSLQAALASAI